MWGRKAASGFGQGIDLETSSKILMQNTICILCQSFMMKEGVRFEDFRKALTLVPKAEKPITLIDKSKYYKHVSNEAGILHIDGKDIFQLSISEFKQTGLLEVDSLGEKEIYLDDNKKIELVSESIKWIIVVDPNCEFGLFFYMFDLKIRDENSLHTLSENSKIFRYLKDPGGRSMNVLKVFDHGSKVAEISFYSIFEQSAHTLSSKLNFISSKPVQLHFLDKNSFLMPSERESYCYNLLRIPASPNKEIEKKYFDKNQNHVYENSSLYSFVMSEGVVIASPYKSPRQLVSNFFAAQLLALFHKERTIFLLSHQAKKMYGANHGSLSDGNIKKLKSIRKVINLSTFFGGMPISQYSEIQEVYRHLKNNFFGGEDFIQIKESLNEVSLLIQEELEQEGIDRERKIGMILGVLGITGFISFIFDYLLISKNEKLIDTLDFPLNALPFFLFLITFVIIWRFLNKKSHD